MVAWRIPVDDFDVLVALAIHSLGFGEDVLCAYLAETRAAHPDAPAWRRRSGTRNGVAVSCFLHAVPDSDAWCDATRELLPHVEAKTPRQRVFIAWLRGDIDERHPLVAPNPRLAWVFETFQLERAATDGTH